jgi:hypothetical protein
VKVRLELFPGPTSVSDYRLVARHGPTLTMLSRDMDSSGRYQARQPLTVDIPDKSTLVELLYDTGVYEVFRLVVLRLGDLRRNLV